MVKVDIDSHVKVNNCGATQDGHYLVMAVPTGYMEGCGGITIPPAHDIDVTGPFATEGPHMNQIAGTFYQRDVESGKPHAPSSKKLITLSTGQTYPLR